MEGINRGEGNRQYVEKESKFPGIRFEPWFHGGEILPGFDSVLLKRLREYNPKFIAIDGNTPMDDPLFFMNRRFDLLARPTSINAKDNNLFVVRGDMLVGLMPLRDAYNKFWRDNKASLDALEKKDNEYTSEGDLRFASKADATVGIGLLIYWLANKSGKELLKTELSRRKFLQLGAKVAGAAAVASPPAGILSNLLESFTPNETTKDIVHEVSNVLTPSFLHFGWWVNGRTAVEIAKIQDSIDYMEKPYDTPAAVVMGDAHNYKSTLYLNSRDARQKAIHDLAKNTLETCLEVFKSKEMPNEQKNIATNLLLDYVAATDIISYPLKSDDKPQRVALFLSEQVLEATRDLRPA